MKKLISAILGGITAFIILALISSPMYFWFGWSGFFVVYLPLVGFGLIGLVKKI
jgi:uncharacterized membrane protein